MVYVAVAPLTVTVAAPDAPQLPLWVTPMLTVIGLAGAGLALIVNVAVPPSVMPLPAEIGDHGVRVRRRCVVVRHRDGGR